jgi:hypothetical protein
VTGSDGFGRRKRARNRRLVLLQPFIDDLPQKSVIGPGQIRDLDTEFWANPMNPGQVFRSIVRLTMNSAEGVVQRGVIELGRPAASEVPVGTVEVVPVRALLLGERLDTRALERDKPLGIAPLTVEIAGGGIAVLFRYGAIVLFAMATAAMDSFVASL